MSDIPQPPPLLAAAPVLSSWGDLEQVPPLHLPLAGSIAWARRPALEESP
jgi:hypothetical protein